MENGERSCGDCRTWEEEMYWKWFSSRQFCVVLSSVEYDYRKKIDLPRKFKENTKSKVPDHLILEGPSGARFEVKVRDMSLVDGWEDFASSYSLKDGDILVMKYDGTPHIPVVIFSGDSHCEKESAYFFRKCGHRHAVDPSAADEIENRKRKRDGSEMDPDLENGGGGNKIVENGDCVDDDEDDCANDDDNDDVGMGDDEEEDCVGDDDDIGIEDDEESDRVADEEDVMEEAREENGGCESGSTRGGGKKRKPCKTTSFVKDLLDSLKQVQIPPSSSAGKQKSNNVPSSNNNGSSSKSNNNGSSQAADQTPIITNQTRPLPATSVPESTPAAAFSKGQSYKKSVSFYQGQTANHHNSAPSKIKGRGRPRRKDHDQSLSSSSPIGKRVIISPQTRSATTLETKMKLVMDRARAEEDTMSFATAMKPSHVYRRFLLTIPTVWFAKNLPSKDQQVILMLGHKKWAATLLYTSKTNAAVINRGGWKQFVQDNKLDLGDVCLFKLVSTVEPIVFNIRIFKVDSLLDDYDDEEVQPVLCTTTTTTTTTGCDGAATVTKESSTAVNSTGN